MIGAGEGIGITDEHEELRRSTRGWLERHCPPAVVRAALEAPTENLATLGAHLAQTGWVGLAVSEARGGDGYGLSDAVVVVEELGRSCVPGPILPTILVALTADIGGGPAMTDVVRRLVEGATATVTLTSSLSGSRRPDGSLDVAPSEATTWGVGGQIVLAAVDVGLDRPDWVVLERSEDVVVEELPSTDPTRRSGRLRVLADLNVEEPWVVAADSCVEWLSGVLIGAEAVGVASWCTEIAADYAKVREQFGRPIGQFQAVKHRCADMLLATERARASVWDAARGPVGGRGDDGLRLAMVAGAGLAVESAVDCAKDCIQTLGGIGFTWEHDAHLYLKRALAQSALIGGPGPWFDDAAGLALGGMRRRLDVDLPAEAEALRPAVAADALRFKALDGGDRQRAMAAEGYVMPHWPEPWGRGASPLEQVVIAEELRDARVRAPHLQVGAWVLPTIIAHGTTDQQDRWIPPTMEGELIWCQLFSEPGAGSDLASLTTKAVRGDGGWLVSGQKVWTTMAHFAHWGICLARTDPEAPKHQGITCFLIEMSSPGIDVHPLKELTGAEMFNEVFLSDVFVPDDCVVGEVNDGWRVGRTTLANERVSMGDGSSFGFGLEGLLSLVDERGTGDDAHVRRTLGRLVAEEHALAVLGIRMTLRALSGAEPGSESSVRKLLGVEHDQRVQEIGVELLGTEATVLDGRAATWVGGFLANRCLTIAGGTSEVQRNVIAERLLGLPRDP